jgi:prepilin-type N-terminal cleavage/methylation domain-containing protein
MRCHDVCLSLRTGVRVARITERKPNNEIGTMMFEETKRMNSNADRGFSILELMIVIVIGTIMTGVSMFVLMTGLQKDHVDQAYTTTLSVLRTYRNMAITQGNRYIVTFYNTPGLPCTTQNPSCIEVQVWGFNSSTQTNMAATSVYTYLLPSDVQFAVQTFPAATPDGFGSATSAIWTQHTCNVTESGEACIVFSPDGSAQDDTGGVSGGSYIPGNYNNALVYITRPSSNKYASRALTVWGATGIVRGWRLLNESGSDYWVQQ